MTWSRLGGTGAYHPAIFNVGGSERMRIDAVAGNVGIGHTSPASTLDVNGSFGVNVSNYTSDSTMGDTDMFVLLGPGVVNVYMPSYSGRSGRLYFLRNFSGNAITLRVLSGEYLNNTLNGTANIGNGWSQRVCCDGTNGWWGF